MDRFFGADHERFVFITSAWVADREITQWASAILSNKFISYTQTGHTGGGMGVQLKLCTNTLGSLHF